ncbi:hypothetical protein AgCh_025234 [Apium graveolens]
MKDKKKRSRKNRNGKVMKELDNRGIKVSRLQGFGLSKHKGGKKNAQVLDSGCSGDMTGYKSLLLEFEEKEHCEIISKSNGKITLTGVRHGSLYEARVSTRTDSSEVCLLSRAYMEDYWNWHKILSRLNFNNINELVRKDLVRGLPNAVFTPDGLCDSCQKAKQRKTSFKSKTKSSILKLYHLLHVDLFGPVNVMSIAKKRISVDYKSLQSLQFENKNSHGVYTLSPDITQSSEVPQNNGNSSDTKAYVEGEQHDSNSETTTGGASGNNSGTTQRNNREFMDQEGGSSSRSQLQSARKWSKSHTPDLIIENPDSGVRTGNATQNESMQEELNEFERNKVWTLVPRPKNRSVVGTKWVFRKKTDSEGIVTRNKATGCKRLEAIRIFLAYAAHKKFKVLQMDVKSAFLNGEFEEKVYIEQPPGFIDPNYPDHVYLLDKALYGLKQAPRAWMQNRQEKYFWKLPISWRQISFLVQQEKKSISTSTAEAEYIAAGSCYAQILWMKNRLLDYGLDYSSIPIYCDNQSAIVMTKNPVQHSMTKHISIKYHFIREHVEAGIVELIFVPTDQQVADIFTKPLYEATFTRLVNELGIISGLF